MRCVASLIVCVIFLTSVVDVWSEPIVPIGPIVCNRSHEEYQCGSACQTTCATLGEVCPIVNIRCNDACYCIEGYARDAQDVCIPQSKCPSKKK